MPSKNPCHLCNCGMDLKSKQPNTGAIGREFCRVKGRLGCPLPRASESTPFAADSERALCEGEMKKYPFKMTEAKERRGSLRKQRP